MTNTQIPAWICSLAEEGEEDSEVDEEELPPLID
jgi:hypothetical protein